MEDTNTITGGNKETIQEFEGANLEGMSVNNTDTTQKDPPQSGDEPLPQAGPFLVPVVEAPATTPTPPKKEPKAAKQTEPKQPTRQVMSVAVSTAEYDYLKKVYEARKTSGLSESWNQFLKQCINFAVNYQKGWQFGVPKNLDKIYLD
jgi:hypothetical protein